MDHSVNIEKIISLCEKEISRIDQTIAPIQKRYNKSLLEDSRWGDQQAYREISNLGDVKFKIREAITQLKKAKSFLNP